MPDPFSFENLVKDVQENLSTDSVSASSSLADNSFVASDAAEAARNAFLEYQQNEGIKPGQEKTVSGVSKSIGTSFVSGAARFVGDLLSAPTSGVALDLSNIPQDYLDAYLRVKEADDKGLTGPEIDAARAKLEETELPPLQPGEDPRKYFGKKLASTETYGSRIESALGAAGISRDIKKYFDKTDIVDQRNRQELSDDLSKTYDLAAPKIKEGAAALEKGDIWGGLSAIADGTTDLLFGGGSDLIENPVAVAEYVAENVPQLVTGLFGKAGKVALAGSTSGYAGDIYTKAILDFQEKNEGRLPTEAELKQMAGSAALAGIADLVGDFSLVKGLQKAKSGVLKSGGEVAKSTATEAATEAFQTRQEQRAQLKDADYKEIYEAFAIGGAVGGSIRGTGEVVKGAASTAAEGAKKAAKAAEAKAAKDAAIKSAVTEGDFSGITDPELKAEAIVKRNKQKGVSEEEKKANIEEMNRLVQEEQTKQADLYEEAEQLLSQGELTSEAETRLGDIETELGDSNTRLFNLRNFQAGVTTESTVTKVTPDEVAQAKQGDTEAAQRVFGSYRIDPDSLSEQDAIELAESPAFSAEQKAELKNHAELQGLIKSASEVSQNILVGNLGQVKKGDKPFLGIKNYQDLITGAVNKGDTAEANKYLGLMQNFVEHQKTKANFLKQATDSIKSGNPVPQDIKNALAEYGIKKFTPATIRFYENTVQPEADLLEKAYNLLSERVSLPTQGSEVSSVGKPDENVPSETIETGPELDQDTTTSQPRDRDVTEQPVGEVQRRQPATEAEPTTETVPVVTEEVAQVEQRPEQEASVTDQILSQPVDETAPITSQNLVAKNFAKGSNKSALDTINNFIASAKKSTAIVDEYVAFEESENARVALNNFLEFYDKVSNSLDTMFKPKKPGYEYQDYVQFLAIDGKLPENVKAAIAIGAYDWITNNASQTVFNTDDDIRSMLGMGEDSVIPAQIKEQFRSGIPQSLIVQGMGQSAAAALNIRPKKTSMMNQQSMFENSLGLYSFALVRELGWMDKPIVVKKNQLDSLLGPKGHTIQDTIRLMPFKTEGYKLAQPIRDTVVGSKVYAPLMRNLFSVAQERPEPAFKPEKAPTKVRKSYMKVPKRTQEILNKVNSWKWNYNKSYDLFAALDRDSQRAVMGYDFEADNHIKANQLAAHSKNDAIDREIDALNYFADLGYGKDFYMSWDVWKNQRMGIKNVVNPQSSKLHRHFVGLKNWTTKVDPNNKAQYNKYLVTVAGGFGLLPEKKSEEWVLEQFKSEVLSNEVILGGIEAMRKLREEPEADFEQQQEWYAQIVAAVKEGGENAYTFQALETLAAERIANGGPFEHSMFREIDGITNGVNITTIQFPDLDENMFTRKLARQGMYFDATEGFADWKTKEQPDSYEGIASKWKDYIQQNVDTNSPVYLAMSKYVGEINRNTAKSPLMTTIYGAGIDGVIAKAASIAVDEMYTKLEDILKRNASDELKVLAKDLKLITGTEPKFDYLAEDLFEANKNFELKPRELNRFIATFEGIYKDGLSSALEAEYSDLFAARDKFNGAINLAGAIFTKMYNQRVEALRAGLDTRFEEITVEQHEAIIREMAAISPVIPTLMSGKDYTSGVNLMKTEQVKAEEAAYTVDTSFNLPNAKSGKQEGRKLGFQNPGVGAIPIAVQSLDASNMVRAMNFSKPFLNVHDAQAVGDADAYSNPQLLNYSHYKNMSQYSIPKEFSQMFDRVLNAADQSIIDEVINDPENAKYLKQFEGMDIRGISGEIRKMAVDLTKRKNERLEKVTTAGQYYLGAQSVYQTKDLSKQALETAVKEDVEAIRAKATNQPKTMGEQASTLGSSQNQSIKDQYTFETHMEVNRFNVQQVFDYLGNLGTKRDSATHTAHLKTVLDDMVAQVLDPIDLHIAKSIGEETKGMITGTDMYIANQDINMVSSAIPTRMSMSSQEVLTHELIHAITAAGLDKNITARREMKRLYEIVARTITPEMLANYSQNPHELAAAKETWDYLFNPRLTAGRSNYLHEFMAFSMTNEPFRALLADIKTKPDRSQWFAGDNMLERISSFFSTLLDWLNGKFFTGTYNLSADKQMDMLVRQVATIGANNRGILINAIDKGLAPLSMVGNKTNQFIRTSIARIVQTNLVQKSKYSVVRVSGDFGRMVVDSKFAALVGQYATKATNNIFKTDNAYVNEMSALITEAKGRTTKNAALHDIKRIGNSAIDRMRQQLRNAVAKHLLEEFDPTSKLTKEQKTALSYAFIKTDMNVLVGAFGLNNAIELMRDPSKLNKQISAYRNGLDNFTTLQAENLGYFMSTGYSRIENALLNPYNISRRAGTGEAVPTNAKAIEKQVDVLASLYAIKYMDRTHRTNALEVVQNEMNRGQANGITALIYTLDMARKEAKEKTFKNTPELFIKGYMADHIDPNIAIKVGLAADEAFMNKQGYVKGPKLEKDLSDPLAKDRYIYVNNYGGMQAYLAGAVYLQSKKSRGTDITDLSIGLNDLPISNQDVSVLDQIKKSKSVKAQTQYSVGKLPPIAGAKMVPVVNGAGEIVSYRYIMGDAAKDKLMNRDASFEVVMGIMRATSHVKPEIEKQNKRVVRALFEQFTEDYADDPSAYVTISKDSTNARYSEIWNMLPYEMKQDIREVWGKDRMIVRREHVDLLFGYRKYSVTNKWRKDPDMRNFIDNAIINSAELFFGSKAVPRIRAAEDFIQELVKMGKDVIVIKSFVVTVANTVSNLFLLSVKGINPVTAMKDYTLAYKAAQDYKRKNARIANYRLKLENPNISTADKNLFEREIAKLTEDLAASPVADLINQGVLQNIVEDVDIGTDTFSFKRGLIDKATEKFGLEQKTKNVPQWMKSLVNNALVLQGSTLYNNLRDMAQLSDFGARYALYNNLTQKKGMSKEEAIGIAMDTFIDYDLPSGVGMQYANDMGIVLFSKYLVRIQKIIFQTFRENPAAVIAIVAMQNYFNYGQNIHESLIGVTNPFDRVATPLDMVAALDDSVILNTVSNSM